MRALAAASIVVYHVWLYGADGQAPFGTDLGIFNKPIANLRAGVTLFFVLSGFLLFRPYVAAALRGTVGPSARSYFRNRALRILPAYWVILCVVTLMFERQLWQEPQELVANLFLAQNYVPSYTEVLGPGIVPAWSLAIEVIFYLAVPLLGGAAIYLATRKLVGRVAAAFAPVLFMIVLGIVSKVLLYQMPDDLQKVWSLGFFTHADWFAAGMALAVLRVLWEDDVFSLPRGWQLIAAVGALGFGALGMKLYYGGPLSHLEYQSIMAIGCGLILALVVLAEPGNGLVRFLSWKPIAVTGLASYSLFLWHDPLLRGLRDAGLTAAGTSGFFVNLLFISVVSGIVATLTYLYVEKPALALKRSSFRDPQPAVMAEPLGSLEESDLEPARAARPAGQPAGHPAGR